MTRYSGESLGFHIGPLYFETTSEGEFNVGISLGVSGGEGMTTGGEAYAEISFGSDGVSCGAGLSGEIGEGVNLGTPIKSLSFGAYGTHYESIDTRKD